jgi:hypothetical protein
MWAMRTGVPQARSGDGPGPLFVGDPEAALGVLAGADVDAFG